MTQHRGASGEPRPRPSLPGGQGSVRLSPTILNNVETYANVPQIILKGR